MEILDPGEKLSLAMEIFKQQLEDQFPFRVDARPIHENIKLEHPSSGSRGFHPVLDGMRKITFLPLARLDYFKQFVVYRPVGSPNESTAYAVLVYNHYVYRPMSIQDILRATGPKEREDFVLLTPARIASLTLGHARNMAQSAP